jgi:hypothetical protein
MMKAPTCFGRYCDNCGVRTCLFCFPRNLVSHLAGICYNCGRVDVAYRMDVVDCIPVVGEKEV